MRDPGARPCRSWHCVVNGHLAVARSGRPARGPRQASTPGVEQTGWPRAHSTGRPHWSNRWWRRLRRPPAQVFVGSFEPPRGRDALRIEAPADDHVVIRVPPRPSLPSRRARRCANPTALLRQSRIVDVCIQHPAALAFLACRTRRCTCDRRGACTRSTGRTTPPVQTALPYRGVPIWTIPMSMTCPPVV